MRVRRYQGRKIPEKTHGPPRSWVLDYFFPYSAEDKSLNERLKNYLRSLRAPSRPNRGERYVVFHMHNDATARYATQTSQQRSMGEKYHEQKRNTQDPDRNDRKRKRV